jgi:hypothetical protein
MAIRLDGDFEVVAFSDLSYEGMTVDVTCRGERVAQLNMDKGIQQVEIELFCEFSDASFVPRFQFDELMTALAAARELLVKYAS